MSEANILEPQKGNTTSLDLLDLKMLLGVLFVHHGLHVAFPYRHPHFASFGSIHPKAAMNLILVKDMCLNLFCTLSNLSSCLLFLSFVTLSSLMCSSTCSNRVEIGGLSSVLISSCSTKILKCSIKQVGSSFKGNIVMNTWWFLNPVVLHTKQQLVLWSRCTVLLNHSDLLLRVMALCVVRPVVPAGLLDVCAQCWGDNRWSGNFGL